MILETKKSVLKNQIKSLDIILKNERIVTDLISAIPVFQLNFFVAHNLK